jgi:flagellar motor switch protein FliN
MTATDVSSHDALVRLGASSAEAIAQVLEMFAPGAVERGDVTVLSASQSPFNGIAPGSVAASVSYVDGVTGANIFVLTAAGVRNLAMAMGMPAPEDGADAELSELELSAVGEASNQMMAAAASAIGVVLGQEIEISVPDIRVLDDPQGVGDVYGASPHATSTTFLIGGESCRLIQLVPRAFVVRMARALDELEGETLDDEAGFSSDTPERDGAAASVALTEALTSIKVRVWAELGRSELGLGRALGLPLGSVVELDREANAPVDLYVNGLRFAQGHLLVTDDGEWAFRCDTVGGRSAIDGARAAAAPAFAPEIPVAVADVPVEEPIVADTPADEPVQDLSAAETPVDIPQAVTAAETPAAPSTPNEEGAVT